MKIKQCKHVCGRDRADILGLSSNRFILQEMSENAEDTINNIKLKDRSELSLDKWTPKKYCNTDVTKQLFDCPDDIARDHLNQLSLKEFTEKYEKNNTPLIIDGCTQNWDLDKYWTFEYFYRKYKNMKFKVGVDDQGFKLTAPLKYFLQYMVHNRDDSPLHLFESQLEIGGFLESLVYQYHVPPYFKEDLLRFAGEKYRPPHRWFLIGPERSGRVLQKDPLNASVWNSSLIGHKRWVLFPEHLPKFVVKGKGLRGKQYQDQAINYFVELLPQIIEKEGKQKLGLIEFIQYPGQTVFIPGGWWYAVMNLDDTMSIEQSLMTNTNFDTVWRTTRCKMPKFSERFLDLLERRNDRSLYLRAVKLNQKDGHKMGDKYEKQSVSLSFTSSNNELSDQSESISRSSKRSQSEISRNHSRSRQKQRKPAHTQKKHRRSST